jgi:hypothetical protein
MLAPWNFHRKAREGRQDLLFCFPGELCGVFFLISPKVYHGGSMPHSAKGTRGSVTIVPKKSIA